MNNKITFVELVDLMSKATSTSSRVCELFLRELFATVSQSLIDGEQVKIKGVGTFKITKVKARKSVNVTNGQEMQISGYNKVSFTPDKALAEAVNQPFAQFETVVLDDAVTDEKLAEIDKESMASPVLDEEAPVAPLPESLPEMPEPAPVPSLDGLSDVVPMSISDEIKSEPAPKEPVSQPVLEPSSQEQKTELKEETPATVIKDPVTSKPMLVGRPIDGPKQKHAPEPEKPEEFVDDNFHRPAPRNAYKPTAEQIARNKKPDRRWLWALLAALAVGTLIWLFARGNGGGKTEPAPEMAEEVAIAPGDSVVQESDPVVMTDTITTKVVLTTLADKYYDSQWFWVYIYEENKDKITDPNNVRPGTVVVIPPAEKYGIDVNDPASLKKAQHRSWELLRKK